MARMTVAAQRTRAEGTPAATPARRLFTVDDYHAMTRAGILSEDDRVELIEGEIVVMSPVGSRHAACVDILAELLIRAADHRTAVRVQSPIGLGGSTEPQPDVCVLVRREDAYSERLPGSEDVLLIIEVSDTSRSYDRRVKAELYARHGIQEFWLIDLGSRTVEAYRTPGPDGYGERSVHEGGQRLPVPGLQLDLEVRTLFPYE